LSYDNTETPEYVHLYQPRSLQPTRERIFPPAISNTESKFNPEK
jgi:hypothetical protein